MERVQVLIDKLVEQKRRNEAPAQMLMTVQLLQNELQQMQQAKGFLGTSKVSVVLPSNNFINREEVEESPVEQAYTQPAKIEIPEPLRESFKQEAPKEESQEKHFYILEEPVAEEVKNTQPEIKKEPETYFSQHDIISELPTFIQHQPQKEVHELISGQQESLNDRLKQDKKELAHLLKDAPVKDLRKAIGINDKFVFLNDLFRGDEAMYERSIKTINGFRILSEAEYWINRELKVKLGWNDNKDTVQHFYQLVRRRFS